MSCSASWIVLSSSWYNLYNLETMKAHDHSYKPLLPGSLNHKLVVISGSLQGQPHVQHIAIVHKMTRAWVMILNLYLQITLWSVKQKKQESPWGPSCMRGCRCNLPLLELTTNEGDETLQQSALRQNIHNQFRRILWSTLSKVAKRWTSRKMDTPSSSRFHQKSSASATNVSALYPGWKPNWNGPKNYCSFWHEVWTVQT